MKKIILLVLFVFQFSFLQSQDFKIGSADIAGIKNEAINNSKAFETLSYFCNAIGPRLMWSPQYKKAADWITLKLGEWNIPVTYNEDINKKGKSWTLKKFYANMTEPFTLSIVGNPKCWSPATNGILKSEVVYLNAKTEDDFEKYKGKLKGKIVCIADPTPLRPYTNPIVMRFSDDSLTSLSNVTIPDSEEKRKLKEAEEKGNEGLMQWARFNAKKVDFCQNEGAVLLIDPGYKYYGLNQVWGNIASAIPKDIFDYLINYACDPDIPESIPQISISMEQYNCIIDILEKGQKVTIEADIEIQKGGIENGFSVIAEIPGTDLKNEIVILGAHLDPYPFAAGVVDNGTGVITCMEALRIIKTLGFQPRRTIRIGLWGAEGEGLIGSKYHIKKHFTEGKEKFYTYFNMDFGVGKFRGIYAEENTGAAKIFKEWIDLINDPKFRTVCISSVKNSDQESFQGAGLPGFQFIQDPLDYFKIYHTNMDFVDRVPKDDLKQNSFIMAVFALLAANREDDFPAK